MWLIFHFFVRLHLNYLPSSSGHAVWLLLTKECASFLWVPLPRILDPRWRGIPTDASWRQATRPFWLHRSLLGSLSEGGLRGSALILEAWAALWAAVIWSPKQTPETARGQLLQTSRWTDDGDAGSSPLTQTCALHFIGQHSSDGEECTGSRSHASSRARRVASCYNGPAAGSRVSDKTWDMAESCVYIKCLYLETRTYFSSFIGTTRKIRNSICGLLFDLNFIRCAILCSDHEVHT